MKPILIEIAIDIQCSTDAYVDFCLVDITRQKVSFYSNHYENDCHTFWANNTHLVNAMKNQSIIPIYMEQPGDALQHYLQQLHYDNILLKVYFRFTPHNLQFLVGNKLHAQQSLSSQSTYNIEPRLVLQAQFDANKNNAQFEIQMYDLSQSIHLVNWAINQFT